CSEMPPNSFKKKAGAGGPELPKGALPLHPAGRPQPQPNFQYSSHFVLPSLQF
ncbi:hypothetical protein PoB_005076100, partial [Plakobranchus ocellatus]